MLDYGGGLGLVVFVDRLQYKDRNDISHHEVGKNTDYGFGVNLYFGAEYLMTPKWGIFGRLSYTEALLKQEFLENEIYNRDDSSNGFSRLELAIGLH